MPAMNSFWAGSLVTVLAAGAIFALAGARSPSRATFDEITVGRINIVEPDGTKRLIISNRAQFPGAFDQGVEQPRPDRADKAGMLFVNDEGTENGGLIQKGRRTADGKVSAGLSLTFDRFRQDQALQLVHSDSESSSTSSLIINDVPSYLETSPEDKRRFREEAEKLPPRERQAYMKRLYDAGRLGQSRVFLGTTRSKASALVLNDSKGRARLQLMVQADGQPVIQMLDEAGKVVKTVGIAD